VIVEDQIRIKVYSTLFLEKIIKIDLQNHFEFFLEIPDDCIYIDGKQYSRHEVCLIVTYDIYKYRHRIEALIMPSYSQMEN
jgi:hypothetical protein